MNRNPKADTPFRLVMLSVCVLGLVVLALPAFRTSGYMGVGVLLFVALLVGWSVGAEARHEDDHPHRLVEKSDDSPLLTTKEPPSRDAA